MTSGPHLGYVFGYCFASRCFNFVPVSACNRIRSRYTLTVHSHVVVGLDSILGLKVEAIGFV